MKNLNTALLFIILVILLSYIGCHWEKPQPPTETVKTETKIGKEETSTTKTDVKLTVDNPKPKSTYAFTPKVIHDTIHDSIPYFNPCDSIQVYVFSNDTITIIDSIQGKLIKQTVLYTMYNTNTKRVDTVFVTEPSKFKPTFALGATLQFDSIGYIKPALGFIYARKKASYSGSVNSNGRVTIGGYFNLIK